MSARKPTAAVRGSIDELNRYWPVTSIEVGGAPNAPDWQATGVGSVWVANRVLDVVHQISPRSNRIVHNITVPKGPCNGLAVAYGSVWIPLCGEQAVARISASRHLVEAMIPVAINSDGEGLIAAGLGGVWLLADEGTRLVQIDPRTNTVVRSSPTPSKSFGVVTGFGSLWVTQLEAGTVTRFNPKTLQAEASVATGLNPLFLAAGGGAVWVVNQGDGTVSRVEPSEHRVSATLDLDVAGIGGCISADAEAVWVTVPGIPLTRIDTIDSRVTHQFRGPGGDCLSLGFDSVWLSNHEQGTVARIRLRP